MEIEYNSPEELRKIYFDVTGNDACDCDGEYYQDYCMWLENLHCEGEVYSKHRNESIKAYGNAIVPQLAFQIFKSIQGYEKHKR